MKKLFSILFVFIFTLMLMSCGKTYYRADGLAWMDKNNTPPSVNVSGLWKDAIETWGIFEFVQKSNGIVEGKTNEWQVEGKVAGDKLYFVISQNNYLNYAGILTYSNDGPVPVLKGYYSISYIPEKDEYYKTDGYPMRLELVKK